MRLTAFNLEKVYFDCIDNYGNCFVVYWASLRFYFLRVNYSGLIFSGADNVASEKSSFKKLVKPETGHSLHFGNPALQLSGSWTALDESCSLLLYTDKQGRKLFWDCHHPKTLTNIVYKGKTFQGFGYSETLNLPIEPWNLPIDGLRWGRFLSQNHTAIWINWEGPHPLNKIIWNSKLFEDGVFSSSSLTFNSGQCVLTFNGATVIREGKLTKLLAKMPWLRMVFNSRILNTVEVKYKALTTFSFTQMESGWSLFEIVTFIK